MKTDTPESDAAWAAAWDEGGCDTRLLLDALQKMERELNFNRQLYETECKDMAGIMKTLNRVIKERDDAAKLPTNPEK